jgi:hypothetical protein
MFLLRPAIVGEQRGEVLVVYVSRGLLHLRDGVAAKGLGFRVQGLGFRV